MNLKVFEPSQAGRLADLVESCLGLQFNPERWPDLERGILAAAREKGIETPEDYARSLLQKPLLPQDRDLLAQHLTIGETYFFRDEPFFRILENSVLPDLIRRRRAAGIPILRIWSAGCCTGEEPYSVAMLLEGLLPDREQWNISILGTDVNPSFLARAREGKYGEWSTRAMPAGMKAAYFETIGEKRFQLKRSILRLVQFGALNLAQDAFPSAANNTGSMDVILCRNVLMYLSPGKSERIVAQLALCLSEDGMLALAPVEATLARNPLLSAGAFDCPYIMVRKSNRVRQTPEITERAASASPEPASHASASHADRKKAAPVPETEARRSGPTAVPPGQKAGLPGDRFQDSGLLARVDGNPEDASAMIALSEGYADQGALDKALVWGLRAAEQSDEPAITFLVATILREMGRGDEAITWLESLVEMHPDHVLAHFNLGSLRMGQEGLESGRVHFAEAFRLLDGIEPGRILPGSGGEMTSGRLRRLLSDLLGKENGR